jgi:hypothetical protein
MILCEPLSLIINPAILCHNLAYIIIKLSVSLQILAKNCQQQPKHVMMEVGMRIYLQFVRTTW